MNRKFIKVLVLFCGTSVAFLTGCGPVDMNDQNAVVDGTGDMNKSETVNQDEEKAEPAATEEAPSAPEGGCPTGTCEIPPDPGSARAVQLPDTVTAEPTKIIPTGEKQMATDIVDYHKTHHVWQPSERHHTVHKHRELARRWFTKVVYHPTFRRLNRIVRTGSVSDQVMPTETVTEPVVDYGCGGTVEAVPAVAPAPVIGAHRVPMIGYPAYRHYPILGRGKAFPIRQ